MSRFEFPGAHGQKLAARLEAPRGPIRAYALFAHCFTCGMNNLAAGRITKGLAAQGIATVRFDFTGLGSSEGDFGNTGFTSNVEDLVAAAAHMSQTLAAPKLLVGHSLGGAAVLAAAEHIPSVRAITTIGAPHDPSHVLHQFEEHLPEIERNGYADVQLVGRPFRISHGFVRDIAARQLDERIGALKRALLVIHAPRDATVSIDNAGLIFQAAKHPKSFLSLDDGDHLLTRREDTDYVATTIAAWASRYLDTAMIPPAADPPAEGWTVVTSTGNGKFQHVVRSGRHTMLADEPLSVGGADTGPNPYEQLLGALGSCTAMTIRMYAGRKGWPLSGVEVALTHRKVDAAHCQDCISETGKVDEIERTIRLSDRLDETQRTRLLEIADKCPIHRTLEGEVKVRSQLTPATDDHQAGAA